VATLLAFIALIGSAYTLAAAHAVGRFRPRQVPPAPDDPPPMLLLKPLHGPEPRLLENLATFFAQDWPGPVRIVAGVARSADPAVAAFGAARAAYPAVDAALVADATRHGANAKVGNLLNMLAATPPGSADEIIVLSDSDMAVPPGYLARLADALSAPGVGAVTCVYAGRGDAGRWSEVAAAGVSYQFLPAVACALALGISWPCMGATIALRRDTLDAIGGLEPFRDTLADDHAIGAAVREAGLRLAYPPMVLTHCHPERTPGEWVRRELRGQVTVRRLDPWGYLGSIVTFPTPIALIALALAPAPATALALTATLVSRAFLKLRVDQVTGLRASVGWWLPLRDIASLALYLAAFAVRAVDWRGASLELRPRGAVSLSKRPERR
jgi:ceramide glucosyltransferase